MLHPGIPPEPHDLWTAWSLEPGTLLALGAATLLYQRGLRSLWARAGVGRGIRRWQAGAYLGGLLALVVAMVTPLDPLGSSLFTAHMVQHLVLVLVAAPLLAAGAPLLALVWALPPSGRRAVQRAWRRGPLRSTGRALVHPVTAWVLHTVAVWLWHLPALYDLAVRDEAVHALEHASFLLTGVLFWWVLLPFGGGLRSAPGLGILYLFTFTLHSGILGALLTFSGDPWYRSYLSTTAAWGLTPLEDQQIAGAVMWIPGGVVYLAAIGALFLHWMRGMQARSGGRQLELAAARRGDTG